MYKKVLRCRACGYGPPIQADGIKIYPGTEKLIPVFSLGLQPLANDFVKGDDEHAGFAPLEVLLCPKCNLAQTSVVVRPDILYRHYCYRTSPSQTMLDHFAKLADIFAGEGKFERVLEIGSNDGRFLGYLHDRKGYPVVLGIDPSLNLTAEAVKLGVPSVIGVFDENAVLRAKDHCENFDLVIARHVFCHVDNWKEFIRCLEMVTHDNSLVAIEVPWVKHLLEKGEYDTIYHEHLSYFSIGAMDALLNGTGFVIQRVIELGIHGGALLVLLRRNTWNGPLDSVPKEKVGIQEWLAFGAKAHNNITNLKNLVGLLRGQGKRVIGYGASAKSTVIVNACGFTKKDLDYITDSTLEKMWKFSPGTDIPIVPEGTHVTDMPDYAIMFCWNFANEVLEKNRTFIKGGGKFILPVPEVKIIP